MKAMVSYLHTLKQVNRAGINQCWNEIKS